jgi:hypothetical protein
MGPRRIVDWAHHGSHIDCIICMVCVVTLTCGLTCSLLGHICSGPKNRNCGGPQKMRAAFRAWCLGNWDRTKLSAARVATKFITLSNGRTIFLFYSLRKWLAIPREQMPRWSSRSSPTPLLGWRDMMVSHSIKPLGVVTIVSHELLKVVATNPHESSGLEVKMRLRIVVIVANN